MSFYTPRKTNILKLVFFLQFILRIFQQTPSMISRYSQPMIFLYIVHIYQRFMSVHISEMLYVTSGMALGFFYALGNFNISAIY